MADRHPAGAGAALTVLPGVVPVRLDPWSGLLAVEHDRTACDSERMVAALDDQAGGPTAE